ncbi:hypothetical protein C1H76_7860 [Elsinoe australis]|uniref:Uncharacterized protein n=1 Tax=Elsinoe australis TaxID=40998 RepID=A0A4U7AU16_9PEZI|nr:hypothetical protein C1H76_7860 [Elsinoe australis]
MDSSKPTTPVPPSGFTNPADLSPPSSQGVPGLPSPHPHANANGKRPLSTLDPNGASQPLTRANMSSATGTVEAQEVKTHQPSGYSWTRTEDEPGYAWKNKRAMEEAERAWGAILHKDRKIGNRFGDPFELADREAAQMASQGR